MKPRFLLTLAAAAALTSRLLARYESRSISDSGYHHGGGSYIGYKPAEDAVPSVQVLRGSSDQKQVAKLKAEAYASLVDELVARSS